MPALLLKQRPCFQSSASARPASPPPRKLFIFGYGYTARFLRQSLPSGSWSIVGTQRDLAEVSFDESSSVTLVPYQGTADGLLPAEALEQLLTASHILSTIPPASPGGRDAVLDTVLRYLPQLQPQLEWIGYLSSTSVYGDWQGAVVDESTECRAEEGKGAVRLAAERRWTAACREQQLPLHIFRLAGIYGPGRSALDALQQPGQPSASQIRRGRQKFTARCHVADICQVLAASMSRPRPGSVYNVADDDPTPRTTVLQYASQLLGSHASEAPPAGPKLQETPEPGPAWQAGGSSPPDAGAASRAAEKRVSNAKMKRDLGVKLLYPSYREGLRSILDQQLHSRP